MIFLGEKHLSDLGGVLFLVEKRLDLEDGADGLEHRGADVVIGVIDLLLVWLKAIR